jgi:D-sedoheptulose 7-phosphate isomerase
MSHEKKSHIRAYLDTLRAVLAELREEQVVTALDLFESAYRDDKTVFICGNGGSWATASHWVCDFSKGASAPGKRRFKMFCLGDNIPMLTAYGNDLSYDMIFAEPLRAYARPGDLVVLLTASGNSLNILNAAAAARDIGAVTLGLIGFGGGKLAALVDHQITVTCREYGPVEDLHLVLDHIISLYIRQTIARS